MAARRFSRRVSSRELSCFGFSSPKLTVVSLSAAMPFDAVLHHRTRAAIAERQVVFRRADAAGVAFDPDPQSRVRPQRGHRLARMRCAASVSEIPVEVEVDIFERERPHGTRVTWMFTVSDADSDPSAHVPVTVTGTVPTCSARSTQCSAAPGSRTCRSARSIDR